MARPTKLTPEVQDLIVDGINAGLTFRLTCARVGVNPGTFYRWLESMYREFYEAVERAKADSALRLVSQITLQALTDWRAAAFILERRFPDDYGRRTEVTGKDGGPVKVDAKTQHVFQPSKELWDEILRKRAEFETLRDGDTDDERRFRVLSPRAWGVNRQCGTRSRLLRIAASEHRHPPWKRL